MPLNQGNPCANPCRRGRRYQTTRASADDDQVISILGHRVTPSLGVCAIEQRGVVLVQGCNAHLGQIDLFEARKLGRAVGDIWLKSCLRVFAGVGRFSVVSNAGDGFPHGFEVQIVGPTAGRQVLLQLSLASTKRGTLPAVSSQKVVVSTREM